jgi:hypothetical protein
MNSSKINDWLQVVGLFGVIGSLIFVGLQMKQDQAIAMSAASQARTDTSVQLITEWSANPFFLAALDKLADGRDDELSPSEQTVLRNNGLASLFNYENVHYQYVNGFISEERWLASREAIKGRVGAFIGGPTRAAFERTRSSWRESFRQEIEAILAEIDAEAAE